MFELQTKEYYENRIKETTKEVQRVFNDVRVMLDRYEEHLPAIAYKPPVGSHHDTQCTGLVESSVLPMLMLGASNKLEYLYTLMAHYHNLAFHREIFERHAIHEILAAVHSIETHMSLIAHLTDLVVPKDEADRHRANATEVFKEFMDKHKSSDPKG